MFTKRTHVSEGLLRVKHHYTLDDVRVTKDEYDSALNNAVDSFFMSCVQFKNQIIRIDYVQMKTK
jgi:hypothetical protein